MAKFFSGVTLNLHPFALSHFPVTPHSSPRLSLSLRSVSLRMLLCHVEPIAYTFLYVSLVCIVS